MTAPIGFVFAATGEKYRRLMGKAARSLRAHHPDIPIDIYTEAPIDLPEVDRVHLLPDGVDPRRPRFHALRDTRFERLVMLDVDLLAVAPIHDVFEVIEHFDLAMAHDNFRNSIHSRLLSADPIPAAFPQFNGGVIGVRRSARMDRFVDDWEAAFVAGGSKRDQSSLRDLIWNDAREGANLRVATLPPEYNFWDARQIDPMTFEYTAPRIIHNNTFALDAFVAMQGGEVERLVGRARMVKLSALQSADHTLAGQSARRPAWKRAYALGLLRDIPRKTRNFLSRLTR